MALLCKNKKEGGSARACRPALQQSYFSPDDPGVCRPTCHQSRSGLTTPTPFSPVPVEKRHHQLAPSVGTTVPLQIKLITQLLMVSTRNTSRSNANPPRMQDLPGDADNRPPGTLEAMQANTNEVEALRLTNQRLIGELEQLTRQIKRPRDTRQTQEGHDFPPHEGNTISTFPEALKQKQSLAEPRSTDHNWPLERRATKQHSEGMSGTKNYATLSKEQENYHGSRGSRASSRSSAV